MGDCSSGGFSDDFKVLFWSNGEARVVVLLIFGVVMTVFFLLFDMVGDFGLGEDLLVSRAVFLRGRAGGDSESFVIIGKKIV